MPKPSHLDVLTKDQTEELTSMLIDGHSVPACVKAFRQKHNVWLEHKDVNIVRSVERYRANVVMPMVMERLMKAKQTAIKEMQKFDSVGELRELVEIQKSRFMKMYEKEKASPLLMESVTKEAMNLKQMLVELARLEMDIGILRRAPKSFTGTMRDPEGRLTEFSWSEEQAELLKTIEGTVAGDLAS